MAIDPKQLLGLFGKNLDDAAVQAVIAASGKVKIQKPGRDGQYVFCKEAGYCLLLRPVLGAPRGTPQQVQKIILHSDGQDGYRGYEFPWGIVAGTVASELPKQLGATALKSDQFSSLWSFDGLYVDVVYTTGNVAGIDVKGDYSVSRVLDVRVRATRDDWDALSSQHRFGPKA
jgi:hypothetical protein